MTSYLIPYLDPRKIEGHEDPVFQEYTYGESGKLRGRMLLNRVRSEDYLFFHTNVKGQHFITGYFYVETSMLTRDAKQDKRIKMKYRNPHLSFHNPGKYDTVVFGNPIYSKALSHPVCLTPEIIKRLSRKPKSISRPWLKLGDRDVKLLLSEIKASEEKGFLKDTYLSSSEVQQLLENDIETFVQSNPKVLSRTLTAFKRQHILNSGKRVDLILKDGNRLVVVEIKSGAIGRDAFRQVSGYVKEVKKEFGRETKGVIVCGDVLPAFEEPLREIIQKGKVTVYVYSWKFNLRPF